MKEINEKKDRVWIKAMWAIFGALALAILLFMIIFNFKNIFGSVKYFIGILRPFIIGGIMAYLIAPFCNWFEKVLSKWMPKKKKLPNIIAVISSTILVLALIYFLIMLIIPQLYSSIVGLYDTLPSMLSDAANKAAEKFKENQTLYNYLTSIYTSITTAIEKWINEDLLPNLSSVIEGVGSGVLSALIILKDSLVGLVVMVYALADRKKIAVGAKKVLYSIAGKKWGKIIDEETAFAGGKFSGFLTGKLLDSAIIAVICYIFCLITKMPQTLIITLIVGITNIIPFFGPFIGAIPSALLILLVDPAKCFWFVIFIFILQQIDGNVIGPAILGDTTGVSSFGVLFSVIVFGGLFGFIGMIVGVPLFAVICDILGKLIKLGLEKKDIQKEVYNPDNIE